MVDLLETYFITETFLTMRLCEFIYIEFNYLKKSVHMTVIRLYSGYFYQNAIFSPFSVI